MSGNMFMHAECRRSVGETVRLLKASLSEKNIPLFAEFDHKLNAEGVGMDMPGATVLVFGNPAVGTRLMLKAPSLVREEGGGCRLSCRDACALAREHGLDEHDETVGKLNALLRELLQSVQ